MLIKEKDKLQNKAVTKWIDNNYKGTVLLPPGMGKTFIALKCLINLPKGTRMLFLAETTGRKHDLFNEIDKFEKVFKSLEDYIIEFNTYQSAYRKSNQIYDFIVADEVDVIGQSFSNIFKNNSYNYVLGLSGTTSSHVVYDNDVTKMDIISKYMPVVFEYGLDEGVKEGLSRHLNIYIINHELDNTIKNIKGGSKKKPFLTTEQKQYEYFTKTISKAMFVQEPQKTNMMRMFGSRRSRLLYSLPSKVKSVKRILNIIKGKTILFNNDLTTLHDLLPTMSSRNTPEQNEKLRKDFDNGTLTKLGSYKLNTRGSNIDGLDNVILLSYFSNTTDIIQKLGRLRKNKDKIGNVFIYITKNSKEADWFSKIQSAFEPYNIYNGDIDTIVNKYLKHNESF